MCARGNVQKDLWLGRCFPPGWPAIRTSRNGLLREARAAAHLSSKYIVSIYDIVTEMDACFITMEYTEGSFLREKIMATGPLPIPEVIRLGGNS